GMSTNWDKYSTAEEARLGTRKPPEEYAVVRLPVQGIRDLPSQSVAHTPIPQNRSHTDVRGEKTKASPDREKFLEIYEIVIPCTLPDPASQM
ncbi:MAG: hypothetical protein V4671_08705, partial [Armatimonadota bacterium]